jgi:hypothetical protein
MHFQAEYYSAARINYTDKLNIRKRRREEKITTEGGRKKRKNNDNNSRAQLVYLFKKKKPQLDISAFHVSHHEAVE